MGDARSFSRVVSAGHIGFQEMHDLHHRKSTLDVERVGDLAPPLATCNWNLVGDAIACIDLMQDQVKCFHCKKSGEWVYAGNSVVCSCRSKNANPKKAVTLCNLGPLLDPLHVAVCGLYDVDDASSFSGPLEHVRVHFERLVEEMQCSICLEVATDPAALLDGTGHIYSRAALENLVHRDSPLRQDGNGGLVAAMDPVTNLPLKSHRIVEYVKICDVWETCVSAEKAMLELEPMLLRCDAVRAARRRAGWRCASCPSVNQLWSAECCSCGEARVSSVAPRMSATDARATKRRR